MGTFPFKEHSYHFSQFRMYERHISMFVDNFHFRLQSLYFKKLLFSDSFCQFLSQHSDGSHYVTIPNFFAKTSGKSLFISANTYEKYIVCKDYCIAHHGNNTCFLPAFKYHTILLGNVEELVKKFHKFCFTYQHVD